MPIKIFFCYARKDEGLLKELQQGHLKSLERRGLIDLWYDRDIDAGKEWEQEIKRHLNAAHIILLLISPDFIASDYCCGIEMKLAIERHKRGEACIIPIILRPVYWQDEPLNILQLQALPTNAQPVINWPRLDDALFDIASGIRKVIKEQWLKKSNTYHKTNSYEKASQAIEQALKLDQHDAEIYKIKGQILQRLGRIEDSLVAYDQAICINPNDTSAYSSKGLLLNELGQYENAVIACMQAINIDPSNTLALQTKGKALQKLARYQDALDAYDEAIRIDPDNAENYKGKEQILEDERERLNAELKEKDRKIKKEQMQRVEVEQALRTEIELLRKDKEKQARQAEEAQLRRTGEEPALRTELEQGLKAKQPDTPKNLYRLGLQLLILVALVIISSISSIGIYQNHLNQVSNNAISTAQAKVTATAQVVVSAQAVAHNFYLSSLSGNGSGTQTFVDPLSQESNWESHTSDIFGNACQFTNGAYHNSTSQKNYVSLCHYNRTLSNFAFEVSLTIMRDGCGGMIFRDDGNGNYYYFSICQNGDYKVAKYISNSESYLQHTNSSAINTGPSQQNKIAIVANGDTMTFYVNEQKIDQVQDSSYTSGSIGLMAYAQDNTTDVAYTNAKLWTL